MKGPQKVQEVFAKTDNGSDPFDHGGFQIIVDQLVGGSSKKNESIQEGAHHSLSGLGMGELQVQHA